MFRRIISTSSSWGPLPLRLALAAVFIIYGSGKVLGTVPGPGLRAFTSGPMAQTPFSFMRPAWLWLGAAAFSELLGAILILLGILTRVGAFLIFCVMLTVIIGYQWKGGWFAPAGIEYPVTLLAMSLSLLITGGGAASIDRNLSSGRRR
ncbi:MAG TPA: DoxX family protein [Pyrinomonadaceae bacterium]|nr:DoxX family protein [Pyrinomonadaceae bacterium]